MVRVTTIALGASALAGMSHAAVFPAEEYESGAVHSRIMAMKMVSALASIEI